jgi:hypothetical protein
MLTNAKELLQNQSKKSQKKQGIYHHQYPWTFDGNRDLSPDISRDQF